MPDHDVIGIGVGPANLSLAALTEPLSELSTLFLDDKPGFEWHRGLMLSDSQLTVTHFRDLVTLVDPRSRFSFLNFIVQEGRAFRFLEANGLSCSRREFEQYYQWAAAQLPSLRWGTRVESVALSGDRFEVTCAGGETHRTRAIAVGSGAEPRLPSFAKAYEGRNVLHSSDFTRVRPEWAGRRVVVVGAGQSGAEVVHHLLSDERALPASLTWTSSGPGFQPLDDSPFTNEWFSSAYAEYFHGLSARRRGELVTEQLNAGGDGITDELLGAVYRRLYHLDHVLRAGMPHRLLTSRRAVDLTQDGPGYRLALHDGNRGTTESVPADLLILCTGYHKRIPEYLKPIQGQLALRDGMFEVNSDYSVDFDGPAALRVYSQGFSEAGHGINDTLLSLVAWRSARIVNSLTGRQVYRTDPDETTVAWE
ncbi:SidA/IucD/PvdA family monooxygenase [Kitasatospora sp. NPDC096140]|uniref:lysine N(6)-hydroxylase/L-ornithine N(5)-oxygenase family protein n=1 Tax=Kitasatospora sp. NPDC096140 TaxID=3155425 RepID=UPI003316934B